MQNDFKSLNLVLLFQISTSVQTEGEHDWQSDAFNDCQSFCLTNKIQVNFDRDLT